MFTLKTSEKIFNAGNIRICHNCVKAGNRRVCYNFFPVKNDNEEIDSDVEFVLDLDSDYAKKDSDLKMQLCNDCNPD